jgi:hypothetical protein
MKKMASSGKPAKCWRRQERLADGIGPDPCFALLSCQSGGEGFLLPSGAVLSHQHPSDDGFNKIFDASALGSTAPLHTSLLHGSILRRHFDRVVT